MKKDHKELLIRIDKFKEILDEVLTTENLSSDEIIDISKELDHLIVEYLRLIKENPI